MNRPPALVAILASFTTLAVLSGCSSGPQHVVGPSDHAEAQAIAAQGAVAHSTPALQAPPDPFERWEPPRIRISTDGWRRAQKEGAYSSDPELVWDLEVAPGETVPFEWSARPRTGQEAIRFYQWTLDIADVTDETPRLDEATDLAHWSVRSADATSATIGPFDPGEEHLFYVRASDTLGFFSMVTIRIRVGSDAEELTPARR